MNRVLSRFDSTYWAMYPAKLDELRMNAAANSAHIEDLLVTAEKTQSLSHLEEFGQRNQTVLAIDAQRVPNTFYSRISNGIAYLEVSDVLYFSGGFIDEILAWYFGGTSTKKLISDVNQLKANPNVEEVVQIVNSPGGEAFGLNEAANAIAELNAVKPVTTYVSGYAASGGYFLAVRSGRIVTDAQALLGSIGVVSGWADYKDFYKNLGIIYEEMTSENAPYKRLDIRNEEHRQIFKNTLNGMEKVFIQQCAKGRNVSVEKVRTDFGKGSVMAGHLAVKAGMADETGNLEQVIANITKKRRTKNRAANAGAEGEIDMGIKDDFKAFAAKLGFKVEETSETEKLEEQEKEAPKTETKVSEEENSAREELKVLKAKQAADKVAQIAKDAAVFVAAEIKAGRLYPAEKEKFISNYIQAAADDEASPLAAGSRVENLKAVQKDRPSHGLNVETIEPGTSFKLVRNDQAKDEELDAEIDAQTSNYVATVSPKAQKLEAVK